MRTDLLVGVAAAVVCVVVVEVYRSAFGAPLGWRGIEAYALFAVAGLLLAARRTRPLTVLVLESVLFVVIGERLELLGATFPIQMVFFASLYSAWAWSRHTRSLYVVTALVVAAMFAWLLIVLLEPDALPQEDLGGALDPATAAVVYLLAINVVYFLGAVAWGQVAYRGARQRASAEQRVALELALAHERERQAIGEERLRIARDLHDVVAHHVSSIGVQATGAARVLAADPTAARTALETIGSSSREAVSQMHQLVHLLREDGSPDGRAPLPGIADIAVLAAGATGAAGAAPATGATGLVDDTGAGHPVVEHRVIGEAFAVPETVGHSLFRIAQEALANVRRHSSARRASVSVRYLDDPRAVELEVLDDGRPRTARRTPATDRGTGDSGGFGHEGIRERAALHGGEAEIGPRPQGGYRVRVRVPVGTP